MKTFKEINPHHLSSLVIIITKKSLIKQQHADTWIF